MRSAIPLQLLQNHTECGSSVFIFLKSKTYQINVLVIFRYQNAVIQTRLFAPTLGGTRKLKTGHVEFPPGFRRENASSQTNIQNKYQKPELARKLLLLRRRSWHDNSPPHDFREQHSQPRFCPNIGENKTTIVEAGWETRTNSRIERMRPPRCINMSHTTPKSKNSKN